MEITKVTINKDYIEDFAKERNDALKKVSGEWILFLDSDEVVTKELKEEIDKLNPSGEINGYYIPRTGMVEEKLLRLARKNSGKWERCVHEVWMVKGKIGCLRNKIIHNEDLGIYKLVQKANYYSYLHAKANKLEGKKSSLLKIITSSLIKFFQTYIIKKAYRQGIKGFVFSLFQAFQSFLSWTKLYFLSI